MTPSDPSQREHFIDLLERISGAFADTAAAVRPDDPVVSEQWPTAASMVDHLGGIYAWVVNVVATGRKSPRGGHTPPRPDALADWVEEQGIAVLDALRAADGDAPCWTPYDPPGTCAFWRRRMVHETAMPLTDLRTAAGAPAEPVAEVPP